MGLYHYTTEKRHEKIITSGRLLPSEYTQHDSMYGAGWYLTDLPPFTCEKILMAYCWQKTTLHQRVGHYLELAVVGGEAYRMRDHVYFVPKSPWISFQVISESSVPECTLKPCYSCPQNPEA